MSLRLALIAVLALLSLFGCDSTGADPVGSFDARISGHISATLSGRAAFAVQTDGNETVAAIGLIDGRDSLDVVVLALPGRPRAGTFRVADAQAGGILVLTSGATGTMYLAERGTVTVTRASTSRLAGRFDVWAMSVVGTDSVSVVGTFDAEPGEVADPSDDA